jgi:uncharacterized protein YggT (Ycf19 family)
MGTLFYALAHLSSIFFNLLTLLVIISVAISWFSVDPYNKYAQWIRKTTEAMYRPFRVITSNFSGPIDFAPMLFMIVVVILQKVIPTYLMGLSFQYR